MPRIDDLSNETCSLLLIAMNDTAPLAKPRQLAGHDFLEFSTVVPPFECMVGHIRRVGKITFFDAASTLVA